MTTRTVFDDLHVLRKDGIYAVPENMTWPECYIKTTTAKPRKLQYLMKIIQTKFYDLEKHLQVSQELPNYV